MIRKPVSSPLRSFTIAAILLVLAALCADGVKAKVLASEALAAAVQSGNLDQVRQEIIMDLHQRQRFEFDEEGIERLGRDLCQQDRGKEGVEVLQLNQMIHPESPRAANALGDAYRDAGDDISARVYYDMALRLDPGNEHAEQATASQGDAADLATAAMGGMEVDPEAMQAAMAQAGVEMTPEQMEKMQEAMAEMEAYSQDPEAFKAAEMERAEASKAAQPSATPLPEAANESEFCMVLHRYNAEKRIADANARARVEGEYGAPGDGNRTWNVETVCGDFLVAVPLWADVSPPVMQQTGERSFTDALGGTWVFQMSGGRAASVVYTDTQGEAKEMKRLGDPRSFD